MIHGISSKRSRMPFVGGASGFTSARLRPRCRDGFSLVDLTLTLLILGIVTATAAPRLSAAVLYYQIDGAARRIEADLNYVQSYARYANVPCSLTFSNNPPSYTTTGVLHTNNSGQAYSVNLATVGYSVSLAPGINGGSSITYTASGLPQAGSPLVALTSGTITITSGNQTRTVTIDPVTGKARRS